MRKLIYSNLSGDIIANVEVYQDKDILFNQSEEFINDLREIIIDNAPNNLNRYKIIEGELVERENKEPTPIDTTPTNLELQEEIKELKQAINIMLGGDADGI